MLNEKRAGLSSIILVLLCALLYGFLALDLYFTQTYLIVEVSGGSMEDTVLSGDFVYADRRAEAERGDVVIIDVTGYRDRGFSGNYIIKRLIATEGDAVKCEYGVVSVRPAGESEFVALDEDYLKGRTEDFSARVVGKGEIFFLGDHRTVSFDSRSVGCLRAEDIVGVVPGWAIRFKGAIARFETFRSVFTNRVTPA